MPKTYKTKVFGFSYFLKNPVINATLPKAEHKQRDIWTADILFNALDVCDDDNLRLAINLAFSCSLRMGEMLGLTWNCIDISEESIKNGCPYIFINKELFGGEYTDYNLVFASSCGRAIQDTHRLKWLLMFALILLMMTDELTPRGSRNNFINRRLR